MPTHTQGTELKTAGAGRREIVTDDPPLKPAHTHTRVSSHQPSHTHTSKHAPSMKHVEKKCMMASHKKEKKKQHFSFAFGLRPAIPVCMPLFIHHNAAHPPLAATYIKTFMHDGAPLSLPLSRASMYMCDIKTTKPPPLPPHPATHPPTQVQIVLAFFFSLCFLFCQIDWLHDKIQDTR